MLLIAAITAMTKGSRQRFSNNPYHKLEQFQIRIQFLPIIETGKFLMEILRVFRPHPMAEFRLGVFGHVDLGLCRFA
jgi:hypothetical protein